MEKDRVQSGYSARQLPRQPSISWTWRIAISPILRKIVRFGGGGDRQRETFPSSHSFNPIADSSLSCTSPTKTSMNSLDQKIICLSVCLPSKRAAIHTFQLLFIPTITRISSTQCTAIVRWIRAIVQTLSRPYRDLSSLWFYAHAQIHFSSFIGALVHISITCLFYFNATKCTDRTG